MLLAVSILASCEPVDKTGMVNTDVTDITDTTEVTAAPLSNPVAVDENVQFTDGERRCRKGFRKSYAANC